MSHGAAVVWIRSENFSLQSTAGSPRVFDTPDLKQAKTLLGELAA
jgi:hypothetical protein